MISPSSTPVAPPQPDLEFYSIQELSLFKTYGRDTYRAAFGVEAPPFDPSRPPKTWFDSTADRSHPENVSVYKVVGRGPDGQPVVRQLVIPSTEATSVNLTGSVRYAAYVVQPTQAVRTGPGGLTPQPVNPDYLATHSDALALMFEIGGTAVLEESAMGGGFAISYPPGEARRLWEITFHGRNVNAGIVLKNKYARGVGAPGHWDLTQEEPVWVFDAAPPTGLDDPRPAREVPIRDLLPNESLRATLMGIGVARADRQTEAGKGAGQFTGDDRALLLAIYDAVAGLRPSANR